MLQISKEEKLLSNGTDTERALVVCSEKKTALTEIYEHLTLNDRDTTAVILPQHDCVTLTLLEKLLALLVRWH